MGEGGEKKRDDHRQHAIDAVVVALTTQKWFQILSRVAERTHEQKKHRFSNIETPWEGFYGDVEKAINNMVVSHRVSRKVNGPLHEETLYSQPEKDKEGKTYTHVRKPVQNLSKGEIEDIVDPIVKETVIKQLKKLTGDPKKDFQDPKNLPLMPTKSGKKIPIKKVRVKKVMTATTIGKDETERYVALGSNHHIEIFETKDKKGNIKWDGEVVSTYEAMRRLKPLCYIHPLCALRACDRLYTPRYLR